MRVERDQTRVAGRRARATLADPCDPSRSAADAGGRFLALNRPIRVMCRVVEARVRRLDVVGRVGHGRTTTVETTRTLLCRLCQSAVTLITLKPCEQPVIKEKFNKSFAYEFRLKALRVVVAEGGRRRVKAPFGPRQRGHTPISSPPGTAPRSHGRSDCSGRTLSLWFLRETC